MSKITHAEIIQSLLDLTGAESYLEIGVSKGETFLAIQAKRKVAVDPKFRFDTIAAAAEHPGTTFHAVESDFYFGEIAAPHEAFDVIFIDGLHTFDQSLRDFCNAIRYLKPGGAIVIDDITPRDYEASLPTHAMALAARRHRNPENTSGSWAGDVYRIVFFIAAYFQQWCFAAVGPRGNQLVVWCERRRSTPREGVKEIASLPYEHTIFARDIYNIRPLDEILSAVATAAGISAIRSVVSNST